MPALPIRMLHKAGSVEGSSASCSKSKAEIPDSLRTQDVLFRSLNKFPDDSVLHEHITG
jgi:hypothetical protein